MNNNKIYLFLIISVFLGFLISLFYNKTFNKNFFVSFFLITVVFYIIFYFLGESKSKEDFNNFYNVDYFKTRFYNTLDDENLDFTAEEESYIQNHYLKKNRSSGSNRLNDNKINKYITEEEEDKNVAYEESLSEQIELEEEEKKYLKKLLRNKIEQKPDISKYSMGTPIPNTENSSNGYGPLNINISYNSQNSVNELDNVKDKDKINTQNPNNNNPKNNNNYVPPAVNQPCPTNSTNNLCNQGRVYNNSDWIYGTNAWTNNPDYYIPTQGCNAQYGDNNCPIQKNSTPLNELATTRKYRNDNSVAPLMVNQPWSEYKSGDEPDSLK